MAVARKARAMAPLTVAQGLDPDFIAELKMYGTLKPAHERFFIMVKNYLQFDLGELLPDIGVFELVAENSPSRSHLAYGQH